MWKAAVVFVLAALACASGPGRLPPVASPDSIVLNSSLQPIDVRYGLDANDVELAILLAVADPPEPPALAPGQPITDSLLAAIVGRRGNVRREEHPWTFEGRRPGFVFAGYERENVRMRVVIRFDEQLVMLRILDSRNLGQKGDHIREEALNRLAELESRIQSEVIAVAQRNVYGAPVPASR